MTEAEVMLWSRLRLKAEHGLHFRRQHPIGPFIADFACIPCRLVVEADGATHYSDDALAYDRRRDAYMSQRGWRIVRVTNEDVYRNLDRVIAMILTFTPPPSAARKSAASTSPALAGEEEFEPGDSK